MLTFEEYCKNLSENCIDGVDYEINGNRVYLYTENSLKQSLGEGNKIETLLINDEKHFEELRDSNQVNEFNLHLVNFKLSNSNLDSVDCIYKNGFLWANMDFGAIVINNYEYNPLKVVDKNSIN